MNPDLVERVVETVRALLALLCSNSSGTARRLRELVQLGYGARYAA